MNHIAAEPAEPPAGRPPFHRTYPFNFKNVKEDSTMPLQSNCIDWMRQVDHIDTTFKQQMREFQALMRVDSGKQNSLTEKDNRLHLVKLRLCMRKMMIATEEKREENDRFLECVNSRANTSATAANTESANLLPTTVNAPKVPNLHQRLAELRRKKALKREKAKEELAKNEKTTTDTSDKSEDDAVPKSDQSSTENLSIAKRKGKRQRKFTETRTTIQKYKRVSKKEKKSTTPTSEDTPVPSEIVPEVIKSPSVSSVSVPRDEAPCEKKSEIDQNERCEMSEVVEKESCEQMSEMVEIELCAEKRETVDANIVVFNNVIETPIETVQLETESVESLEIVEKPETICPTLVQEVVTELFEDQPSSESSTVDPAEIIEEVVATQFEEPQLSEFVENVQISEESVEEPEKLAEKSNEPISNPEEPKQPSTVPEVTYSTDEELEATPPPKQVTKKVIAKKPLKNVINKRPVTRQFKKAKALAAKAIRKVSIRKRVPTRKSIDTHVLSAAEIAQKKAERAYRKAQRQAQRQKEAADAAEVAMITAQLEAQGEIPSRRAAATAAAIAIQTVQSPRSSFFIARPILTITKPKKSKKLAPNPKKRRVLPRRSSTRINSKNTKIRGKPGRPKKSIIETPVQASSDTSLYCTCQSLSYGQMVACDNEYCKYKWFHFGCVDLVEAPATDWYCSECLAAMRKATRGGAGKRSSTRSRKSSAK